MPALIILMPILVPIAAARSESNPIHFGILVEVNVALGMAHPPVGVCVYAACAVARIPMERVVRPMLPMMVVLIFTMRLSSRMSRVCRMCLLRLPGARPM